MSKLTRFMFWLALGYNKKWLSEIHANNDTSLDVYYLPSKPLNLRRSQSQEPPTLNDLKLWNDHPYGVLVMSKTASTEKHVPVWAAINEHLKDIDLYMSAVQKVISDLSGWSHVDVKFGASDILDDNGGQLMYSWDPYGECTVPIPKFIYRLIQGEAYHPPYGRNYGGTLYYNAVVIIHNDPTIKSDDDSIDCERCYGWSEIENTYAEPAYVCSLNDEIAAVLGIDDYNPNAEPLHLISVAYSYSEHPEWREFSYPLEDHDQTQNINDEYRRLKQCNENNLITSVYK